HQRLLLRRRRSPVESEVIGVPVRTEVLMGTLVTIHVVAPGSDEAIERAFGWFREIEARCTRFDQSSELMQLTATVGVPVPASAILFEALRFAVTVAEDTDGAFDPTARVRGPQPREPLEPLEPREPFEPREPLGPLEPLER